MTTSSEGTRSIDTVIIVLRGKKPATTRWSRDSQSLGSHTFGTADPLVMDGLRSLECAKYGFDVLMRNAFTRTGDARDSDLDFVHVRVTPSAYCEFEDVSGNWWTVAVYLFMAAI